MKRRLLLLFTINLVAYSYSQNNECTCKKDLTFLDSKIRKTPAYKINKKVYNISYSKTLKEADSIDSIFDCHLLLNKLLLSINDNHSKVYGIDKGATDEVRENTEKLSEFKNSELYNAYPKPIIDLDSLKTVLSAKPKKDIEGIYSRENYITIGVYKSKDDKNYKAIILDSESSIWQKGELIYTFVPFGNNYLLGVGGSISSKRLIAYTERIENGLFYFMGIQKDSSQVNYSTKMPSKVTYYRDEISDTVTYIKVGSFNSWYPTLSDAETFYKTLEGNLKKQCLIVDLRNNGGGGDRNSDILLKLLKKYAKSNQIYVLVNHRTVSNAEQFTYKLSKLKNCLIVGMRTNGSLAYEIKDDTYNLPCSKFLTVLTSKKHGDYLEFESQGIIPDVTLDMESDWITQLQNYISENN